MWLVDPRSGEEIDSRSIKEEIGKVTTLGYENRIFAAKDSHVRAQLKMSNEEEKGREV